VIWNYGWQLAGKRSTVAAGPAEDDVVCGHGVAAPVADARNRRLERWVLEGLDPAAVVADEMVVMVALRTGRLEARHTVAEVDALHEAELVEALERAVHGRDPRPGALRPNAVVDLLR
jgi:hypothetical protein